MWRRTKKIQKHIMMDLKEEDMSLINKRLDNGSSYWKKKYTFLLKRSENVEKQNLRLLNRLYQIKRISKRLIKEKRFLIKRLECHHDNYKKIEFFQSPALCDALYETVNSLQPKLLVPFNKPSSTSKLKKKKKTKIIKKKITNSSSGKQKSNGPKKPLNAFLWFCQEQRDVILSQHPGMTHQELTKQLSVTWNTLEEKEKEAYYEMFDKDKLRYAREVEALQQKKVALNSKNEQDEEKGESEFHDEGK